MANKGNVFYFFKFVMMLIIRGFVRTLCLFKINKSMENLRDLNTNAQYKTELARLGA